VAYEKDYYAVLQVSRNAKQEDIERAYKRLSEMYDPASSTKKRAAQRHADITAAYNVLRDPRRRRQYDRQLATSLASAGSMSPAEVLSNRFVMLSAGVILAGVLAVVGLVVLLGGGNGSESVVSPSPSVAGTPSPSPTPGQTAPASPPAVEATPVVLENGLQYIIIRPGAGTPVVMGDSVGVGYSGWLQSDGTLFDSSWNRGGEPFTFTVGAGSVIDGWDLGVVGMLPGEQRRLIIPPELGYGAQGSGSIPPNSTLIFDIDLFYIGTPTPSPVPAATPPPTPPEVTGTFTTTESGLQYLTTTPGTGRTAEALTRATVNYTGWVQGGELFDSSKNPGRTPYQFELGSGKVIKGWDEGIVGMQVGETRRLIIPPDLGYGAEGSLPIVPPNATLIYDIELLDVAELAAVTSPASQ
jgi:peptidylprolyl isomerase